MLVLLIGLALASQFFASAAPAPIDIEGTSTLAKRNVCDGINATPILYHEYRGDVCPPKNVMDKDGNCPGQDWYDNGCASYCQVRTTFTYRTEAPIGNSYCHGPFTCTITDTQTTTITKTVNLNLAWTKGFNLGISGGFSYADAEAKARAYTVKLEDGQCGYFTIVPVFKDVCGTVTEGHHTTVYNGIIVYDCVKEKSYPNICVAQQRKNPDGTVDSETIFVRTDCGTREPLAPEKQDPVYQKPGVPLDRGAYDVIASNWVNIGPASTFPDPSKPDCGTHGYTMPVADVANVNKQLDGKAGQQCCTPEIGGCTNIGSSGGKAVDICAPEGKKLCIECTRLANYVVGLGDACVKDGNVGGTQDIVETPGLKVEI